ncbi:MAG: transglycosylase domain-containing protein [Actinomycetota bacterium]
MTPKRGTAKAPPKTRAQRWLLRLGWLVPLAAIAIGGTVLVLTYAFASIPLPRDVRLPSAAQVFDANNKLIGIFSGEQRRFLIDTKELLNNPKTLVDEALVSAEDRGFYEHNGISLRGMARAAWADVTSGEIRQGGSTITQQYVKQAVLQDPERTITRKLKEAVLAIKLERRYSKKTILGFYLNTVYFGRGAYGIEAAARSYFGKHANELSLGESAFLAGIVPAPEAYQPDSDPQAARDRRDRVLRLMEEQGYITDADVAKYSKGKVKVIKQDESAQTKTQSAAYFMEWLRRNLQREFGNDLYTRGFRIHTTLDLEMQTAAEEAVAANLADKEDPPAALVSMTSDGAVKAFVGGRAFDNIKSARGFNYASDNARSAGSSLKPFTLLAALENGVSLQSTYSGASPYTVEEPACYTDNQPWEVDNFGGSSYGYLNLDGATVNSVNTIYAQLVAEIGPEKVAGLLEDFQFDGNPFSPAQDSINENCSLALGEGLDVSPLDMARAYATFANSGAMPEIQPVAYIEDSNGKCVAIYRPTKGVKGCEKKNLIKSERVADENSVNLLNTVLQHVVSGGTATSAQIGRPVAGKTGTAQDNKDAWFAGYTPQLATVVWMGYPIDKKSGNVPLMQYCTDTSLCRPVNGLGEVTGGSIPASIWQQYMSAAMLIGEYPIEYFETGTDTGEVVGAPPPPPEPEPEETEPEDDPSEEPEPEPSEEPEPEPSEEPSQAPTINPTPTNGRRGRDRGGGP